MNIADYFYTARQAADLLHVNRITIWRWEKEGKITPQRIGKEHSLVLIPKREIDLIKAKREAKRKVKV